MNEAWQFRVRLLALITGCCVAMFVVNMAHVWTLEPTILNLLRKCFQGLSLDDSWMPMREAYLFAKEHPSGLIYQQVFFEQKIKFQYPPSSLLIFRWGDSLGFPLSDAFLNQVVWFFALAQCGVLGVFACACIQKTDVRLNMLDRTVIFLTGFSLSLLFYPFVKGVLLGQVQVWLNALFCSACCCWFLGKRAAAGVLVGLVCVFKPQFGIFLIWGLLRREWSFTLGWLAVVVPAELAALWTFGWANHIDYLSALRFMSAHGESYHPNQSVNGLVHRWLGNGNNVEWFDGFPPRHAWVHALTLLSSLVFLACAMMGRRWRVRPGSMADFLFAGTVFTMASPIAWEHHYGMLPAAFVFLACALLTARGRTGLWPWLLLVLAHLLSASFLPEFHAWADTPFNFVQSYLFMAGLLVLWLLHKARTRGLGAEPMGRPMMA